MKIKSLILFAIFSLVLVSCEKDMKWINPDDSKADQSEIGKICAERSAECGMIEYEYLGKTRKVFCGKCEEGYDCNSNNKCEKIGGDNDPVSDDTDTKPDEDSDTTPDDDADTDSGYSDTTPDKDSDTTPDDDTDTGSFEDTDMIPDKDTDMTSDNEPDEDENSVDEDIDTDTIPADPCNPNPCSSVSNSTKICTATSATNYSCGCNDGYYWWGIEAGCTDKLTIGNICTGQDKCYDNSSEIACPSSSSADFYGQDAQYTNKCTPQSFSSSTNVVVDNNTGLTWEKSPSSSTYTWANRATHCNELNSSNYGGKSNWRVPNPSELLTIVDNSRYNPATNSNFTNMPTDSSVLFWTSAEYKGDTSYAYVFNPYYGHYYCSPSYPYLKTRTYKVLCVSGDEMQPATSSDFTTQTISGEVVVKDSTTGLMWQKEYVTGKTWQQALKYCEDSTYAGYSDWRLPNKNELASLLDPGKSGAPYSNFPDMPSDWFWSSSTSYYNTNIAWGVHFNDGGVSYYYKTYNYYVRCVRNNENNNGDTGDTLPGDTGDTVPGDTGDTLPGDTGDTVPGDTGDTVPGDTGDTLPGDTGDTLPGDTGDTLPGDTGDTVPSDTGDTVPGDTGDTVPGDTGDAIVVNGGFEEVDENGIPSNWHTANSEGEYPLSSIPTAKISSVTDAAYVKSGAKAVKLTSTKNGNQRFVADGIALEAGNYKCSAYAKGNNYVKIGYCKGSASSCSFNAASHTQLTDEWQQIVHEDISFAADETTINFVIIVNSKESTDKDGYFDDFVCEKVSE